MNTAYNADTLINLPAAPRRAPVLSPEQAAARLIGVARGPRPSAPVTHTVRPPMWLSVKGDNEKTRRPRRARTGQVWCFTDAEMHLPDDAD